MKTYSHCTHNSLQNGIAHWVVTRDEHRALASVSMQLHSFFFSLMVQRVIIIFWGGMGVCL